LGRFFCTFNLLYQFGIIFEKLPFINVSRMKKLYIIIFLLFTQQLFSQYSSTGFGRWKLGLNIGGTWQTASVNTHLLDLGYGATLEYAAYQKYNSFFGFSFRGRFLQGTTRGYDDFYINEPISNNAINGVLDTNFNYSLSPTYLNNRTKLNEFSLEAMLKWNKLYQNHGILFYLYLGGGFTSYKVETDQLDEFGFMYDYTKLSEGSNNLSTFLDGTYETALENPNYNTLVFTPAIGFGIGFRVVPGFDIAFEHKVSLPQTDLFDGQIHKTNDPSFIQDIYHYSSLGLMFSIVGNNEPTTYEPLVEPSEPVIPITPITSSPIKPTIILTNPITTNFNSPNCKVEIIATINHVKQQSDIEFYHNEKKVPSYNYFFSAPTFKSNIELKQGNNQFKVVAKNGNLTETKEFSLQCNDINKITICHTDANGSSTIDIVEADWPKHAAHGDTKGSCPENQITICHNIPGQPGKTQTISIPESQWNIHKSHGDQIGNCSEKTLMTICHNGQTISIDEKDWASHASHGDTKGDCPKVKMITICHIPEQGDKRITMTIPENEWIVHQAHGDVIGSCPNIEPTITICHKNNTNSTITIPEFRWNEHFAHGDSKTPCPEASFVICHTDPITKKKENISIYESAWASHAAHGDTKGSCPIIAQQITICHNIPGQPGKTETITIPESQWNIHKSHGDQLGACTEVEKQISICHNSNGIKSNIMIPESQWASHAAHGDTKGTCPIVDKQITICHNIPGQPGKTQTISIPESQWNIHKSHGDQLGACPVIIDSNIQHIEQIKICHSGQTITIDKKDWPIHQAHGDVKGICVITSNTIKICHENQTIDINEDDWLFHQSHGDTKGECTTPIDSNSQYNEQIKICHNGQTITINASDWPAHQAHGDVKGICVITSNTIKICHENQTIDINEDDWLFHQSHGDTKGECQNNKTIKTAPINNIQKPNKGGK
jgi:hypothetical protein